MAGSHFQIKPHCIVLRGISITMIHEAMRITIACLLAAVVSAACAAELHLVVSVPSDSEKTVLAHLEQSPLFKNRVQVLNIDEIVSVEDSEDQTNGDNVSERLKPEAYIALGAQACSFLLENTEQTPIFSIFTSAEYLYHMRRRFPKRKLSGIVMDQPLERLTALANIIFPKDKAKAVFRIPPWNTYEGELDLRIGQDSEDDIHNLSRSLVSLLDHADTLVLAADSKVCNRNTVKNILLTTYRHGIPIIGYSDKLVRVGSLISTYSTYVEVASQLPKTLSQTLEQNEWGVTHFPHDFKIVINQKVAKSLTIKMEEEKVLEEKLKSKLGWKK